MENKMTKRINFSIDQIADGGAQVKLNRALEKIAENIMDPNTDPTKKRKLQMNVTFEPAKSGEAVDVDVQVKTTLAPEVSVGTTLLIGKDSRGKAVVNELKSGAKGQTYIDPDDGEVKTDTGETVEQVEKQDKVIDLQKKKG
ncbi:hypothetical protein FC19_GL001456 [Liquorilactobacillus aquaticus DSM 21051]|uniref:Replication terminator protein n=2 Tax=Liquorilactobacillus aquaticus TaxID=392566 RepID=A0A0R2CWD0_9LACO|nr:hypothetical protein FC19_GL001456 [Liquorilactobacillus aquaticus DSM 21051]